MAKKTLVASIEYCRGYELKVIWHCSKNARRSSGLEPSNMSGARTWGGGGVGGLGGGGAGGWALGQSGCGPVPPLGEGVVANGPEPAAAAQPPVPRSTDRT